MTDPREKVKRFVGEMLAAEKYVHQLVASHAEEERAALRAEAQPVLEQTRSVLENHIDALERHLDELGGETVAGAVREAVSTVSGKIAAVYEKARSESASRMMRDDYTALSLAAISYTMLHTTALSLHDSRTADLAARHLADLTPLIIEMSKVVPYVVTRELAEEGPGADPTVASTAAQNTHRAWTAEAPAPATT